MVMNRQEVIEHIRDTWKSEKFESELNPSTTWTFDTISGIEDQIQKLENEGRVCGRVMYLDYNEDETAIRFVSVAVDLGDEQ